VAAHRERLENPHRIHGGEDAAWPGAQQGRRRQPRETLLLYVT
jgi:hypothetical protein